MDSSLKTNMIILIDFKQDVMKTKTTIRIKTTMMMISMKVETLKATSSKTLTLMLNKYMDSIWMLSTCLNSLTV